MKRTTPLSIIILAMLSMVACTPRYQGYAVVIWPATESGIPAGTQAPVIAGLEQEFLSLSVDDEPLDLEAWRVLVFDEQPAAEAFARDFGEWADSYAVSLRTALPVRERADSSSTRIYRLREGEVIKILDRSEELSDQGSLSDYWYRALTREGTIGWVFGHHLELTGASGRSAGATTDRESTEELLQDIAEVSWRPEYYDEMVSSGHIDLERFSPRFGLFADTENAEIRIVLPSFQRTYSYTDLSSPAQNGVGFVGTSLELALEGERELEASYRVDGRDRSETFVRFDEDIAEIVSAERQRRSQELEQILNRGNGLASSAFGEMRLTNRGAVTWTGYERLVPTVLPSSFAGSASLEFSLFLSDKLRGKYDGAMLMRLGPGETTAFVYTILDDGLRMTYIPEDLINDSKVVTDEPVSPVVMFYRFVTS